MTTTDGASFQDDLLDRIRLHRQGTDRPIVLVEGPADAHVLKPRLPGADLFIAQGRRNVIRNVAELRSLALERVFGIIDADFDDDDYSRSLHGAIIPYERRDLESMLIGLGALKYTFEHYSSENKRKVYGSADSLIARLVEIAAPITALRYASRCNGWGIPFDKVAIEGKHVSLSPIKFQTLKYCQGLHSQLPFNDPSVRDLIGASSNDVPDSLGPRGKDVVAIAAVVLSKLRSKSGGPCAADLEHMLRVSAADFIERSKWLEELRSRIGLSSVPQ